MKADIIIIGADIVGLATAHKILTTNPGRKVLILEKRIPWPGIRPVTTKRLALKIAEPTPFCFIP
jgi:cation diffusion facilitator CzcD-associated flavoprotein CzcO